MTILIAILVGTLGTLLADIVRALVTQLWAARCMSRSAEPAPKPFWQTKTEPRRLAGTWPALVAAAGAALDGELVRAYDRAGSYVLGELLDHPVLGVGVVVELPAPGRVLVRFSDSDRLLVSGQPR